MAKAEYQVNWGYQRQYLPELYDKPLWQLRAEVERLKREADNGNKYSQSRLDATQQVLDERSTEEEQVWKQDFRHGATHVHIHNNVTAQAPTHIAQAPGHLAQPPQPPATQMSTAAALGLGAGIAIDVYGVLRCGRSGDLRAVRGLADPRNPWRGVSVASSR